MSEQGQGGKKGKGKKHRGRGRGRGGQQQRQQQQQRESESVPGGLQERADEQQGATALPESQEQPTTETKQPQSQQQSQKQTRKQRRQQQQRKSESAPEAPQPPKDESTSGGPQPPREEPQGATALPETQASAETKQPPQDGSKQQQRKQQPKHPDKTDGAGPSKPREHFPTTPEEARTQPKTPKSPPPQSETPAQPSMQPQPSTTQAKPGPPQQPPRGAAKPESSSRKRDSPPRSDAPKLPRRPDAGGRSGRPIRLRANFLPVKLPVNDIYHYDTAITVKGKKSGEGYTNSEAPRIIREIVKLYEKENPSGPKLAYDKTGKNIFCKKKIPSFKYTLPNFMTDNGRERELSVEVKPAGEVSLFYLNEVLEGRQTDVPYNTMQAVEVVLQQMPKMRTIQVRSSFFDYPTGREKDLGGGLQIWNGTFLSIRPTQWKMMLNVDTCSTAFYKEQPVLDFLCQFLNLRDCPRRLDEGKRKKFAKELKAIKVETTHVKRKQKASGMSLRSAREETFDCEGKKVTVFNYFKEKYNITLQYPDLPCVKIGQKGNLIPIELCRVVKNQKKQGRLTGNQTQEMIRHTAIPAPDRLQKIQELIRKLPYHEDPYCRDFGFSIGNDLATITGRVLDPPVMKYGSGTEMPRDGQWKTTKRMLNPMELREWALISYINDKIKNRSRRYRGPDNLDDRGVGNFIHYLVQVAKEKGIRINENPCRVVTETGFFGTEKLFGNLKSRYPNLQLIVVVLPVDGDDFYEEVKHCGDIVHGIMTQCIKVEKASDDFSDWRKRETLVNLCFKINAKLGGTTFALDKGVKSKILSRPVIIFGTDVTHPSPGDNSPSIAAVVASKDSGPTLYNAEVCVQKHRQEMIEGLKESVKNLLKKFHASTRAQPEKIIFYRDGVSEGQFRDVLINELSAIQRACRELSPTYTPAITFIVVQKRHHARLFAIDPNDQRGKSRNIPAGTVVDQQICHPTEFNWYLCSHAGIQGTSKPTLYHVLYDDSNFGSDDLQILTNQLCYTYVRCARSVSMPAAPYYAHHVAFRARHHLKMDSSTEGSQASDDSGPQEVTQAMRNLVKIHPNVDCTMYFA